MERETLDSLRFTFQRVLIPIVVIIGCVGNAISVVVLTRRRMRCTTNIYLTALAIVDIVFLLFILLLSLQHHHALHQTRYSLYWKMYGLSLWITDAAAYTSIWLTVSFTCERYVAVCHPIRGQVLCTESRAKKVIAGCFVMCFLLTVSTAFEYQVEEETRFFTSSSNLCPKLPNSTILSSMDNPNNGTEPFVYLSDHNVMERAIDESTTAIPPPTLIYTENNTIDASKRPTRYIVDGIWCEERAYLYIALSDFGKNHTYKTIFYVLTTILFVFGPLILLATFNCYLIAAVHRSQRLRKEMTNNSHGPGGDSSQQENKITIILIAVCVLFFICQSPTAIVLLYTIIAKPDEDTNEMLALGNVLNFLITINAACNFILYCLLSDKYRHTTWQLLCGTEQAQGSRDSQISRFASFRTSGYNSTASQRAQIKHQQSINERKKLMRNNCDQRPPPPIVMRTNCGGGGLNGGTKLLKGNNRVATNLTPGGTIDEGLELNYRRSPNKKKRSKVMMHVNEPDYSSFLRPPPNCGQTAAAVVQTFRRCSSLNSLLPQKHSPHCRQHPFKL